MIKLFPKIVKMKRAVKTATVSTSAEKHTNSARRKKTTIDTKKEQQDNSETILEEEQSRTRLTRSRKIKQKENLVTEEQDDVETKVDLSKFKLASKQKVKGENSTRKQPTKRQHIPLQYDEDVSSSNNKLKKESDSGNDDESDGEVKEKSTSKLVEQTLSKKMPPHWEEVLQNLREMRKNQDAPVDSMGCNKCPDDNATAEDRRFQALLSLMLSSQTKDQITHAAMLKLREHGCSLANILTTSDEKLGELIYPASFWKTKVKNIKRTAEMIKKEFNSDIPKTVQDLCKLPGVGPKMAHLCMETAWGQVTGIGVDTHVHRITNRLGWVKTKTPEDTRKALEGWLPRDLWSELNLLLVGFGQQTCQAVKPQCSTCLNNQLCPFGKKEVRGKKGKQE